jgi:hypothetical protein
MAGRTLLATKKTFSLARHFHETFESLGGWKGLGLMVLVMALFYFAVHYTVTEGRRKRQAKKRL